MRHALSILLVLVLTAPLCAAENWYHTANVQVKDADTIACDVVFPWRVTLNRVTCRLANMDAWEASRARRTVNVTDAEIAKGIKARDEFKALLATGRLELQPLKYGGTVGAYGRIEANWRIVHPDGKTTDVAAWIRSQGHERR